ncbi:MAG TPA: 1-deoxy-D-xylulose-5-phosphate reductoisomerase, partial [Steroidobacteraceae bacterium]|nr:1-deoxy-D-xylulose-5-phosphate reductoisomerase [Steroidobacteraceae bacterium]
MRGVTILGSTGSVGVSTLDVIARHRGELRALALTAHSNDARLFDQCLEHRPELAVLLDAAAAERLRERLRVAGLTTRVLHGTAALEEAARWPQSDYIMAAIVGAAGLLPTLAAARSGKRLLLANKESLVMSGQLLIETARSSGTQLIPIDSEHNAIFQCLGSTAATGARPQGVRRIILTASGGPFLNTPAERLA